MAKAEAIDRRPHLRLVVELEKTDEKNPHQSQLIQSTCTRAIDVITQQSLNPYEINLGAIVVYEYTLKFL